MENKEVNINDLSVDRELFLRIAEGDAAAFEKAYHHYYPRLFAVAISYGKNRELAEDVTHQIMLKLWENRKELLQVKYPVTWLYTAAKYEIWESLRKIANSQQRDKKFSNSLDDRWQSPEELLIDRQREHLLKEIIQSLPTRQLQVYRMGREQGLTYLQIARQLGISRETVKELMAKALRYIRTVSESYRDQLLSLFFSILFY